MARSFSDNVPGQFLLNIATSAISVIASGVVRDAVTKSICVFSFSTFIVKILLAQEGDLYMARILLMFKTTCVSFTVKPMDVLIPDCVVEKAELKKSMYLN